MLVSRPPSTGPSAAKNADPPARIPSAVPRRSLGYTALVMATPVGIMSAAPTPCTARAAIIQTMSCAPPAAAVPNMKITAPARNTRRSPSRSPRRPPNTSSAASGRMFAVRIHWPWATSPPRSEIASAVASGTAVWSTRIMLAATVMAASVIGALPDLPVPAASAVTAQT